MSAVTVIARLTAKTGKADELAALTAPLIAATRAEAGCLRYDLLRADEDPCAFAFLEEWISREALAKHLASGHIGAFRAGAAALLDGSDVTVFHAHDAVGPLPPKTKD